MFVEMPDEITAAVKVALAARGVTVSDADAEAVRSAIERAWAAAQGRRHFQPARHVGGSAASAMGG
jgi:hypothetical protein